MVRVAGLSAQMDAGITEFGPDHMTPSAQLVAIRREVKRLRDAACSCLEDQLEPLLEEQGIRLLDWEELNAKQVLAAKRYFSEIVFPVLTPLAFDPGRPFPHISNLSLNLAVSIRDKDGVEHFARVKVPDSLPALVPLTRSQKSLSKRSHARRKEAYRVVGRRHCGESRCPFPGHGDCGSPPIPCHSRRGYCDQGTGGRRPSGDHGRGCAATKVRERGAIGSEAADAQEHPTDSQQQSGSGFQRGLSE